MIARIELSFEIEVVCARSSLFFFNNFKIFNVKKPLMFHFQSSQEFSYPFASKRSFTTLLKLKERRHFVDDLRPLHANG